MLTENCLLLVIQIFGQIFTSQSLFFDDCTGDYCSANNEGKTVKMIMVIYKEGQGISENFCQL